MSISFAQRSISLVARNLHRVVADPRDYNARADIMDASLLGGMAISSTKTAIAHSISYPLTAQFGIPHGLACSFTLDALLRMNYREVARASLPPCATPCHTQLSLLFSVSPLIKGNGPPCQWH